jgi:hypothetical protein
MEWWDCATGTVLSTSTLSVTNGSLTAVIPTTSHSDLAYKIIANSAGI